MTEGTLFNSGFLGTHFNWWIGQIPNDETWRDNINPTKHKSVKDIPGWGLRYKVRIIGFHDQEETSISSDQLPWAQIMYPVTAGGGQGGAFQTSAIRPGNFVFGFFLDGADQQVPVIMGVLGANVQIPKAINKIGAENYTSKSGYSGASIGEVGEITSDDNLTTERPSGKSLSGQPTGGKDPNNPPAVGALPTKESPTDPHLETVADKKIEEVLDRKHALQCPDPKEKSAMKAIKTVIENLQKKIEQFQKAIQNYSDAVSLNIKDAMKSIDKAIEDASAEISKFMKDIYGKIQEWMTDKLNKMMKPLLKLVPPSFRIKMLELLVKALKLISCLFNKLSGLLQKNINKSLKNRLNNQKNESSTSESDVVVPPLPPDNYYRPIPICTSEELVADILVQNIDEMMLTFSLGLEPILNEVQNSYNAAGMVENISTEGSVKNPTTSKQISNDGIIAALQSGALVKSITATLAESLGVDPNIIGSSVNVFQSGDIAQGLISLATVGGKNTGQYTSALSIAVQSINNNNIVEGLTSISGVFGADPKILSGVGAVFGAIKSGDIGSLTDSVGQLAGISPQVLSAVQQAGSALASGNISAIAGQFGSLTGLNFDIASAMDFISSLTSLFDCDPTPKCSPNHTHTLQEGGNGNPGTEDPSSIKIAQAVQEKALAAATGGGTLTGAGTVAEAKKFALPSDVG